MTFKVLLKTEWIYSGSGSNMLCIRKLISKCSEAFGKGMDVVEADICSCVLDISAENGDLKEKLKELLIDCGVPADRFDEICSLTGEGSDEAPKLKKSEKLKRDEKPEADKKPKKAEKPKKAAKAEKPKDPLSEEFESLDDLFDSIFDSTDDDDSGSDLKKESSSDESALSEDNAQKVLNQINALVGADDFKAFCHELHERADRVRRHKTETVLLSCAYLFFVNKGQQFDECVKLFAKLLSAEQILPGGRSRISEIDLPPYGRSNSDQSAMESAIDQVERQFSRGGVITIDITHWASHTDQSLFKNFMKQIAKSKNGTELIIFRCLPQTPSVTKKMMADIQDLLPAKAISIRDYTDAEFLAMAGELLQHYGYRFSTKAKTQFGKLVDAERADGSFYGKYTIQKIVNQLISVHEFSDSDSDEITVQDLNRVLGAPLGGNKSAEAMLSKVYGLESVKQQIMDACQQILYAKKHGLDMPSFHMVFLGNPGTGKTTVARIVGQILHEAGALRIGNFYEHKARDLCGEYIGHTEKITNEICSKAYGSVLFLDEAYSLYRGERNDKDFGREAIATLLTEMENHSNDFIVIFAGYTDEMQSFLEMNPGLKSRIPFYINFPNYSPDELYHIFKLMATAEFKCSNALLKCAEEYFTTIPKEVLEDKTFGNARYVRSIYERTWGNAAKRAAADNSDIAELLPEDFKKAVEQINGETPKSKKPDTPPKIGF